MTRRVVIIGGGFGGLQCALRLARRPVDVTVIDRENHHLFQPLLYQVATAGLSPGSIAIPIRSVLGRYKNIRVILADVETVALEDKRVKLRDGSEFEYDNLVIAIGARTNYFGNDSWSKHAPGLKTVRDALRLREKILLAFEAAERETDPKRREQLLTFVVIGGGATGVEMAGAIAELGRRVLARDYRNVAPNDIRVVLLEMGDRLLTAFHEQLSERAVVQLEDLGVEVCLRQRVVAVDSQGVRTEGMQIPASVVCWATGVKGESLVDSLGVEIDRGGRIIVDQHCALPAHPEVFAIGDVARFQPAGEEQPLPGVAPAAIQQGRFVADTIVGDVDNKPRKPFRYVDKGMMATIGRKRAVAQADWLPLLDGFVAWLAWCFVHVLFLIGFHNRFIVVFEWVWSYFTFARGARLITAHIKDVDS